VTPDTPPASDPLDALRASVIRLRALAEGLAAGQLTAPSYCSEWTIAQVLSHIGSGAVIMRIRVDDVVAGRTAPDDVAPSVWDEWNAKAPAVQAADAMVADRALIDRLGDVTPDERAGFAYALGPLRLDFDALVRLRLNEHTLHSWDVAVALRPEATLDPEATALVVDNIAFIAGFTARPPDVTRELGVRTRDPERRFRLGLTPEGVSLAPRDGDGVEPDLDLPAEALIRLVYGRLDPDHTPDGVVAPEGVLDLLRRTFPGL
jgi:uncharacterized protein (TIGR03083 family)